MLVITDSVVEVEYSRSEFPPNWMIAKQIRKNGRNWFVIVEAGAAVQNMVASQYVGMYVCGKVVLIEEFL